MPLNPREVRKFAGEEPPIEYPDVGVYQRGRQRIVDSIDDLSAPDQHTGTVGLLLMRSYAPGTPVTTMSHQSPAGAGLKSARLRCRIGCTSCS